MKKIFLFIAIATFVGSVFTSCKSHERCPAYGKVNKADTEKVLKPV